MASEIDLIGKKIVSASENRQQVVITLDDGTIITIDSKFDYDSMFGNDSYLRTYVHVPEKKPEPVVPVVQMNELPHYPTNHHKPTMRVNSLVQLTIQGVCKTLEGFRLVAEGDNPVEWRAQLRKYSRGVHPIFEHPGLLFMGLVQDNDQGDREETVIVATHGGQIEWGYPLAMFEPFKDEDH